jgi:phage-related protein
MVDIHYFRTASGREPVREYIASLPEHDQTVIFGDLELIMDMGIVTAPVITRKLQGYRGLWEIKTGSRHQQRIFYCTMSNSILVLLHACKKEHDSQPNDVATAARRMKEIQ